MVDVTHTSLSDPSNHVRTLEAGSGQKAILTFSETTSKVSALLLSKDGTAKLVANENLPKDFNNIKTLDSFNGFLENAQARGTVLSDGEAKLYVQQKGLGGMWKIGGGANFNPVGGANFNPVGPMGPICPPGHGTMPNITVTHSHPMPPSVGKMQVAQIAQQAAHKETIRQATVIAHLGGKQIPQAPYVPDTSGIHAAVHAAAGPHGIGVSRGIGVTVPTQSGVNVQAGVAQTQYIPTGVGKATKPDTTIFFGIKFKK